MAPIQPSPSLTQSRAQPVAHPVTQVNPAGQQPVINNQDPTKGTTNGVTQSGTANSNPNYNIYDVNQNAANNPYLAGDKAAINTQIGNVQGQKAAQATATTAPSAALNNQGFNAQGQNLAQLQQEAQGQGPAAQAVQMQTQNATNQGINAQLALAGSVRGGNAGEMARQGALGQAAVTGQAANQAQQNTLASEQQGITNAGTVAGQMQGESLTAQNQSNQNSQFNAGQQNQVALANSSQQQQQQQYQDTLVQQYLAQGETLDSAQAAATAQMAQFATNSLATQQAGSSSNGVANTNATTAQITGVGGLVNSGVQTLTSDKRAKKDVKKGDDKVSEFLNHLAAKSYNYKDPDKHGAGKRLGVMAQDLEKSELGKPMVGMDEDGTKNVNYGGAQSMSNIMASLAHLNDKIKELEKLKSKKA